MSDGKVYEMLWDCQFCSTKGNLGLTHRFCPNCGAPQNPDSRYYPSDQDKVAVQNHKYVGVDVTCPSCNELNSGDAEFCGQCGSPLTEGAKAKTLDPEWRASHEQFQSGGSRDIVKEDFDAQMQAIGVQPIPNAKKGKSGLNLKTIGILAVLGVIFMGAIAAFNLKSDVTLIVTDHEWERIIEIEEYNSFTDSSWRDSPPSGVDVSMVSGSCRREQRSTRRIADGETCRTVRRDNGDGTFSERQECTTNYREEPVYDDMCRWEGFRWDDLSPVSANGVSNLNSYWPETNLDACGGQAIIGCQREAGRRENYWVIFENAESDREYRCKFSLSEWEDIAVESVWTGQVRTVGGGIICDSLQQN